MFSKPYWKQYKSLFLQELVFLTRVCVHLPVIGKTQFGRLFLLPLVDFVKIDSVNNRVKLTSADTLNLLLEVVYLILPCI